MKKRSLVNWNIVCLPVGVRGLGIRRISEMNDACMLKLDWQAMISSSSHPYGCNGLDANNFKRAQFGIILLLPNPIFEGSVISHPSLNMEENGQLGKLAMSRLWFGCWLIIKAILLTSSHSYLYRLKISFSFDPRHLMDYPRSYSPHP